MQQPQPLDYVRTIVVSSIASLFLNETICVYKRLKIEALAI